MNPNSLLVCFVCAPASLLTMCAVSGSGGAGRFRGGDGVVRDVEFRLPLTVSVLTGERLVFCRCLCVCVCLLFTHPVIPCREACFPAIWT